ncbi:C40 family peptidase [Paenibacillus hamazuiensis]|uniref:C40 family peptidase n=1 Tax=Paenibacillus hamazuiensis TaxID=2936508 RepID=UPI00200DE9C4|nr:C40 family peptidase [Paenibacillus hamazuiensis]
MNMWNAKQWAKKLMTAGLGAAILFSGSMALPTHSAYAYSSSQAQGVISTAKRFIGTPYRFGSPIGSTRTFDCSSFTWTAFHYNGINLPRSSQEQSRAGQYVPKSNLMPGDLVFFYSPIHHVGIYIGNGKFIHTWGGPGVMISDLNQGWWKNNYTTARRVL